MIDLCRALGNSPKGKEGLKDTLGHTISVSFQCRLLGIGRSTHYYKARETKASDISMMNAMDRFSTDHPTSDARTLRSHLRANGYVVGLKYVCTLMRLMDISAIYPQKCFSKLGKAEYKKPYLLRGLDVTRFGQVWSMDISYIPMPAGFMYMLVIIDVYSRYARGLVSYQHSGRT